MNDELLSSWSTKHNRNLYQVEWAEVTPIRFRAPQEKIVKLPFYGGSKMFDMLAIKKYLLKNCLNKIIVVTSDYHTRRALWTFRLVLKAYPSDISAFPADPTKRHLPAPPESSKPIIIGDNVWIGQSSIILKGVTIGAGSVIGAGSIVTKNVPPNSLAVGSPVRCIPLEIANPPS